MEGTSTQVTKSSGWESAGSIEAARQMLENEEALYDLSDLFRVFADTTRIKILYALTAGELSVSELSEAVDMSQSAVSHHLRTLKQARLVKFTRSGRSMRYSLCDEHVTNILDMGMNHICE